MKSLNKKNRFIVVLVCFIVILFLGLNSYKNKRHHLIEDVAKEVRHEEDTVGWNGLLRDLHGVWVHRKYLSNLDRTRSIYETNRAIPTKFTVLNIDTKQFISDSLQFLAITANDVKNFKSCIYFGKSKGQTFMHVLSHHPIFKDAGVSLQFSLDTMEFSTYLTLEQEYKELSFGNEKDKDRYVKISNDVSQKEYEYYPLIGIEIYMRKYLKGAYNVYNADNQIVKRNLVFNEDGTISNHPFAKYRLTPWVGFDALLIQGMSLVEEQPRVSQKYYGIKLVNNDIELYQITKNRKDEVIMGDLAFRLVR